MSNKRNTVKSKTRNPDNRLCPMFYYAENEADNSVKIQYFQISGETFCKCISNSSCAINYKANEINLH